MGRCKCIWVRGREIGSINGDSYLGETVCEREVHLRGGKKWEDKWYDRL